MLGAVAFADGRHAIVDAECGLSVSLPSAEWKLTDQSAGASVVHIYSPSPALIPRFTAIRSPAAAAPGGLAGRARQVSSLGATAVEVVDAAIAGQAAQKLEYVVKGVRAIEYGVARAGDFLLVQVVATETQWADATVGPELRAIFGSVAFAAAAAREVRVDATTPAQVRAARAALDRPRLFAVRGHDVRVRVDPGTGRLECRDTLRVEGLAPQVRELTLRSSIVSVDSLRLGTADVPVERLDAGSLRVRLPEPLHRGESAQLEWASHAEDYFLAVDQNLVTEIAVLAQVRAASSYSSHGFYFPVDDEDDAAVELRITVPEPYVAVAGGAAGAAVPGDPGWRTFAWSFDARPRQMPPGFAVAKYTSRSATTAGGLSVEVHALPGGEQRAAAQLAVALRAAALFETRMGGLPWRRVAVCHVRPQRKETAVSLPGLILLSDAYFQLSSDRGWSGEAFAAGEDSGSMAVVDELAHQWNFYAASYPNEFAEGLSTFACLLFLEGETGAGEYRKAVRACAATYIATAERVEDVAVANPALYASDCYRTVAFAKVPAVLDLLRARLGEKAFFEGWLRAFAKAPVGRRLTYDDFRGAFEEASGADLGTFFEQWFFRAGHPRVRFTWEPATTQDGPAVRVRAAQVQPAGTFEADVPIEIRTAGGSVVTRRLALRTREDSSVFALPAPPVSVALDPHGEVPLVRPLDR